MKRSFSAMITVEAAVIFSAAFYLLFVLFDLGLYFYDENALSQAATVSMLRIQNYKECGGSPETGMLLPVGEKLPERNFGEELKRNVNEQCLRCRVENVQMREGHVNLEARVVARYHGFVPPFRNLQLEWERKFPHLTPAREMRQNRLIHGVLEGGKK